MSALSPSASLRTARCVRFGSIAASVSCVCVALSAQAADSGASKERVKALEEVIVTAQRRAEVLQDVPIAITVMSGEKLDTQTFEGVSEALRNVPGVTTGQALQSGGTQLTLRGVTAGGAVFNGSSPIAYYLDSAPFGLVKSAIVPDSDTYDLERIEVLRGPQGTLYGATAQNGVVRIITHDADLDAFDLKARTSVSSTEEGGENYRGDVAVNVPLIQDKLAVRVVGGYQDQSGWVDSPIQEDLNDAQLRNVRVKVNAQPTENFRVGLSAWNSKSDYGAPSVGTDELLMLGREEDIEIEYDLYSLKLDYDFSGFSITSATSYLDYGTDSAIDLSFGAGDPVLLTTDMNSKVVTEELTLNSDKEGDWRWSLGAMYRDGEDDLVQTAIFFPEINFSDTSKSTALFGELTRVLADGHFEVTAGLRHFEDKVEQIENLPFDGDFSRPLRRVSKTFDADSPRFVLTWLPTDGFTAYASYAEGFRSGFNQNANVAADFPPVDADNLKNYEIGIKGVTTGGVFSYDAALYYIDWQDVQQTLTVPFNGAEVTALVNGESASGMGFDLGMTLHPTDSLGMSLAFSWNDLQMDADIVSDGTVMFHEGDRLNWSPELTVSGSIDYTMPLSGGYEALFATSGYYTSEQSIHSVSGGAPLLQEGDTLLVARVTLGLNAPNHWSASLFADNVNNERGTAIQSAVPFWSPRLRPRTYGLQLEYRF